MTDIVARLRTWTNDNEPPTFNEREAADEIERLREQVDALRLVATSHEPEALRLQAEIERLRAVVSAIDEHDPEKPSSWRYRREALCDLARRALEPPFDKGSGP